MQEALPEGQDNCCEGGNFGDGHKCRKEPGALQCVRAGFFERIHARSVISRKRCCFVVLWTQTGISPRSLST